MRTRYLSIILAIAAVTLVVGCIVTRKADASDPGKRTIDFTMTDTNGKTVQLSSYRGKVVIVDVWATWCGYCVREIPGLVKMQEDAIKNKTPLRIIGVSVDNNKEDVVRFVKDHGVNYPVVYSEKNAMKPFGDIYGLPTKFIINKKGAIVDKIIGGVEMSELQKRVAKYLK